MKILIFLIKNTRTNVVQQKNVNKSLILLTNIFENRVYFACFVDFCMLPYMYINN